MAQPKKHGITIQEFQDGLKRKQVAPLYFFFGEEEFLLEESVDDLKKVVLNGENSGFNLDTLYGGEVESKDIVSLASMFPMMGERKMVIVRDFEKLSDKDLLIPYLEHPLPSTSLAIISPAPDYRLKIYKALESKSVAVGFDRLKDYQIPAWLKRRIESQGKSISQEAIQLLHIYSDRSLRDIQNEIDKLFIYVGDRNNIELDDVNTVTGIRREYSVFELQKSLGLRDFTRSIEVLGRLLETGESASLIIGSLTKYFQKLWVVLEMRQKGRTIPEVAAFLNFNPQYPKFIEEYLRAANNFSVEEFGNAFDSLLEADRKLKSSAGDTKLVMTILLYNMLSKQYQASAEV